MQRASLFLSMMMIATFTSNAFAIEPAIVPEPPELPEQIVSGQAIEPDITIIRKKQETVTEYSINGNVYMVKITPDSGPAYYLIDNDGDGQLETRQSDLERDLMVPQWLLMSW